MFTRSYNKLHITDLAMAVAGAAGILHSLRERLETLCGRPFRKFASPLSSNPRAVMSARGPRLSGSATFGNAPALPKPMRSRNQYPLSARGFALTNGSAWNFEAKRSWHGQ
jgi:hypothetical protein